VVFLATTEQRNEAEDKNCPTFKPVAILPIDADGDWWCPKCQEAMEKLARIRAVRAEWGDSAKCYNEVGAILGSEESAPPERDREALEEIRVFVRECAKPIFDDSDPVSTLDWVEGRAAYLLRNNAILGGEKAAPPERDQQPNSRDFWRPRRRNLGRREG
jgi:hypothetical protein